MPDIQQLQELRKYCEQHGAKLVAVSKTKTTEEIQEVYNAGQRAFGENKVQEMTDKHPQLPQDIEWHMIGHLQRNKVKYIAPFVHLIHSVDSERLLREVNKQGRKAGRVIPVLLQVHIAEEETKYGFDMQELRALLQQDLPQDMPFVAVHGLMGMATFTEDKDKIRREFTTLSNIFREIKDTWFAADPQFREISMGMSADYTIAVEEGSTMIRVGSLIFGAREY